MRELRRDWRNSKVGNKLTRRNSEAESQATPATLANGWCQELTPEGQGGGAVLRICERQPGPGPARPSTGITGFLQSGPKRAPARK